MVLLIFSQHPLSKAYSDSSKPKWNILNKTIILLIPSISHATTQNWMWMKFLWILIVPCNCFLLLELTVSAALAHTFWTLAEFTAFLLSLSVKQTEQIACRLLSSFFAIAVKLIVSKPHPILSFPRSVSVQIWSDRDKFYECKANRVSYWASVSRFCGLCMPCKLTWPAHMFWEKRAFLWLG